MATIIIRFLEKVNNREINPPIISHVNGSDDEMLLSITYLDDTQDIAEPRPYPRGVFLQKYNPNTQEWEDFNEGEFFYEGQGGWSASEISQANPFSITTGQRDGDLDSYRIGVHYEITRGNRGEYFTTVYSNEIIFEWRERPNSGDSGGLIPEDPDREPYPPDHPEH